MKIKFTKLPTNDGTIKVSLDGGQSFTDYSVADVHEGGIPLSDNQDYEKIQIQAPANILKNLNVVSSVKVEGEGAETGSTNEPVFIMDTDTYGFNFPKCVTEIIIPNGITTIDKNVFSGYPNLQSIVIPEGVTSIGYQAFQKCTSLTSVTIPESVTSIDFMAFAGCKKFTSITIPESITKIDNYAFMDCSGLTSITIPDGVTSIGDDVFKNCTNLQYIDEYYLPTTSGKMFLGKQVPSDVTDFTIRDDCIVIGGGAFSGCTGLTSITIPEGVTSIGVHDFTDCTSLTSITIPKSVTKIDDYAFMNCSGLFTINYRGIEEQWNAIIKGNSWNRGCPSDMVINYNYQG